MMKEPHVGYHAGQVRQQQRIVFTDDGGRTWHVQYASRPTS